MSVEETVGSLRELVWFKSGYSSGEGGQCLEIALEWRTSSYSSGAGGECVEVAADWRKSSHSGAEGGECVEVAACPGTVHVRDSKDTAGPILSFAAAEWAAFVEFAAQT